MVVDRGPLGVEAAVLAASVSTTKSQALSFGHSPLLGSSPINPMLPDVERRHARVIDAEYHSEIRLDDSRINRVFRSIR